MSLAALALTGLLARKHTAPPSVDPPPSFGVGSSFSIGPVAFVLFGLVLVALVGYLSYVAKQRRRAGFRRMAAQLGLSYSQQDPFGILGFPYTVLHLGDGQGIENVVSGTWQGFELTAFDYWYYTESTDSHGSASRTYRRFDCVLVPIDADCPRLSIRRESFLTSLADALSFHDLQFESEEFNRAFNVRCEVPKFANDLVDARMMAWLLSAGSDIAYEAVGRRVLVAGPRIQPVELTGLLAVACGFVQHVPSVVSSLYPG